MREKKKPKEYWPSWRYGPDGRGAIFTCAEEIPEGWTRKPFEVPIIEHVPVAPIHLSRADLIAALDAKGVHLIGHVSAAHMKKMLDE